MNNKLTNYLDEKNRVKVWPSKQDRKLQILNYLSTKFDIDRFYSEKEVNEILQTWHTFNDYFLLRRGLIEARLLCRTNDGSRYWKQEISSQNNQALQNFLL